MENQNEPVVYGPATQSPPSAEERKQAIRNSLLLRDVVNNDVIHKRLLQQTHSVDDMYYLDRAAERPYGIEDDMYNESFEISKRTSMRDVYKFLKPVIPTVTNYYAYIKGSMYRFGLTNKFEQEEEVIKTTLQVIITLYVNNRHNEIPNVVQFTAKILKISLDKIFERIDKIIFDINTQNPDAKSILGETFLNVLYMFLHTETAKAIDKSQNGGSYYRKKSVRRKRTTKRKTSKRKRTAKRKTSKRKTSKRYKY